MPDDRLTPRQQRFVDEYIKDRNGSAAAVRAGYAPGSSDVTAARLLGKASVRLAVDERIDRASDEAQISAAWVRRMLRDNVERAMTVEPVLDVEGQPIGVYKYAGNVANRALELLGKDQGMFTDRLEVTLGSESRALIEELAKLAVSCCAEDKRKQLVDGLADIRARFAARVPAD